MTEDKSRPEERSVKPVAVTSFAVFLTYLTAGIALPVIPLFVHDGLGMNNVMVGIAVGIQFFATLANRGFAGKKADQQGAKQTTRLGMGVIALVGVAYLLSVFASHSVWLQFGLLLLGRILLGLGESFLLTGNLTWGLGLIGQPRSGIVMSWNGMAIYGSLAAGAPIGLYLYHHFDFLGVSLACIACPIVALLCNAKIPAVPVSGGDRPGFATVLKQILTPGAVLALQGVGFAVIGAFISLYFAAEHWGNAGYTLTIFGLAYVLIRVFFGGIPDKMGGIKVTIISLGVEMAGLLLLCFSQQAWHALVGAALTGAGCSLVFPAMGVEIMKRVDAQVRGTALGCFSAFQDVAYGATGPLAGFLANSAGYGAVYLAGACCALIGVIVSLTMLRSATPRSTA
ncbi:arabinose transporter [Rosenbergiella epipactidis]|uniref:arabinose transporter n=1 Tax=Rosenbergiella epipactidis TaxID=1544694 RepID=UPI002026E431|nr:arabinose transporter [Rosenbergiella epipactidis]MCL9668139.1 arabinose transporter [Rosenbergiella epipactidis]